MSGARAGASPTAPGTGAGARERAAIVLGTAGHVDHGKTALVRQLTGQDTDRLKEERERGISIELGFAHFDQGGRRYGVIDVPGHERFVRHMLAGAHGIDLVLLVVAADDGVMPQTEEHFDIVRLLGVRRAIFVVSKIDLVDDERRREVGAEIEALASGSAFASAPICPVSSTTGEGIDELRDEIARQIAGMPSRPERGLFRLPIDRAFSLHGHGLVVTGTAIAGTVQEGDLLALRPGSLSARARTLQVHGERVARASAGQRVAVNLAGLERGQAERGQVLVDPRLELASQRFDCWLEICRAAQKPLASFDRLRIHLATAEVLGRAIVLAADTIAPETGGFCQIVLDEPVLPAHGDRFIVRNETATCTIGGGMVLQPFAPRHRTGEAGLTDRLECLRSGEPGARAHAFLELLHEFAAPAALLAQALSCVPAEASALALGHPEIVALPAESSPEAFTTRAKWQRLEALVGGVLDHFHNAHPLAAGMELESLRSRLPVALPPRLFRPVIERMARAGVVLREDALVRRPEHRPALAGDVADRAAQVERAIVDGGFTPPDTKQLAAGLEIAPPRLSELLAVLERRGAIVRVAPDLFLAAPAYAQSRERLRGFLRDRPEITVAEYRTLLNASRKYALALLEHFDRAALTIRVGDARRLRRG